MVGMSLTVPDIVLVTMAVFASNVAALVLAGWLAKRYYGRLLGFGSDGSGGGTTVSPGGTDQPTDWNPGPAEGANGDTIPYLNNDASEASDGETNDDK